MSNKKDSEIAWIDIGDKIKKDLQKSKSTMNILQDPMKMVR